MDAAMMRNFKILFVFVCLFKELVDGSGSCGGRLVATQTLQELVSPNHPGNYPNNVNCTWLIVASNPEEQVEVNVTYLRTEPCCDYMEVKDGSLGAAGKVAILRGIYSGGKFASSFGALQIVFVSDASVTGGGFSLNYRVARIRLAPVESLEARVSSGVLVSPNWPLSYPENSIYTWNIVAPNREHACLTVLYLKTEACCDGLMIRDGMQETSPILGVLRGEKTGLLFSSSIGVPLSLRFYADGTNAGWGFFSSYFTLTDKTLLGIDSSSQDTRLTFEKSYNITEGFDVVFSPDFPNKYYSYLKRSWVITSPPGTTIRLWFSYIDTEPCCDWIKVRDGESHDQNKIGVLSGNINFFQSFISTGNSIRIEFDTDLEDNRRGFIAYYEVVTGRGPSTSSCGGELSANSSFQFLSSPNWPQPFLQLTKCVWRIRSNQRSTRIEFTLLGLIANPFQHKLKLYDGSTEQSEEVLSLTDNSLEPITFTSSGSYMTLSFSQSASNSTGFGGGFRASYITYPS